jgi:hypothetical protein
MAVQDSISWEDINGIEATNRFYVADAAGAVTAATLMKKLSNAKIVASSVKSDVDISGVPANNAAAANVETARAKMVITLSGPPPGANLPRVKVTLEIPAPVGSYINGLEGDKTNADIVALLTVVKTNRGETVDTVDRVIYAK